MYRFILIIIFVWSSCSPKSNQSNSTPLSFEGVEIPLQGTAVIGEIVAVQKLDNGLSLLLKIASMKQGGAGSPFFEKNSEKDFILSNNMIRLYEDRGTLQGLLQAGSQVLIIATKDLRSDQYSITQIINP